MSSYRFYNARILSMQDPIEVVSGEVHVVDDRITFVGKDAPSGDFEHEIDAGGDLIMPGFKNAHTHSAMVFARSAADDLPLDRWLNETIFPMEAKLDEEKIYHLTRMSALEHFASGTTSVFEMYLTPSSVARAFESVGMRNVQTGAVNNFSQSLELLEQLILKLNEPGSLSSFVPGFHAEYTCSRELMEGVAALGQKYRLPVWMHNSETKKEVEECRERYGMSPTALMESMGMFEYGGGGYHCVWLDEGDMEIFRKRNLTAVTCPCSNAKLASGIAPLTDMLDKGLNVAIGTDGPASNNGQDMFREMYTAAILQKLRLSDAAAMDAVSVLKMATVNSARAMGLADCDVLAPGKKADLIMLDMKRANMRPENNIPVNLVYAAESANVRLTMIDGVIRYRDGEFFVGADPEEIFAKASEITEELSRS